MEQEGRVVRAVPVVLEGRVAQAVSCPPCYRCHPASLWVLRVQASCP